MSVKRIKQIITITVLAIIVLLIFTSALYAVKYYKILDKYQIVEELDTALKNGSVTEGEYNKLLAFLDSVNTESTISYHTMYEDLYVENDFIYEEASEQKTCYLTFDDGPDPYITTQVLDILKQYNVKATFFVVYRDTEEAKALYKRIIEEGHTIGVHTASHDYEKIYASVEDYLDDFNKISKHIEEITGVKPEIFRFPGGSISEYNKLICTQLASEMIRRGYTYYDWNVSASDTGINRYDKYEIVDSVLKSNSEIKEKIVLLHDGADHDHTVYALDEIIEGLTNQGYVFSALNKDVKPVIFAY